MRVIDRCVYSVTKVTVRHHEVMPHSYPEWWNFQFAPKSHYGFFFLHTLPSTIVFKLEYALLYQFYATMCCFSTKQCIFDNLIVLHNGWKSQKTLSGMQEIFTLHVSRLGMFATAHCGSGRQHVTSSRGLGGTEALRGYPTTCHRCATRYL